MIRREYQTEVVAHRDGTYSATVHINPEEQDAVCNAMADKGWKLVNKDGSILLFERVLSEDAPGWLVPALPDLWEALTAIKDIRDTMHDIREMLRALSRSSEVDESTLRGEA